MGRIVVVAFRPKPGRQQALLALVAAHWRLLHEQQLVTDRPRYAMQAADGTIVEVFEWRSAQAIERAHTNPAVLALWSEFEATCDYVPVGSLPEASRLFSEFDPLPV